MRGILLTGCVLSLAHGLPLSAQPRSASASILGDCSGFDCLKRYVDLPDDTYSWHSSGLRLASVAPDTQVPCTLHVLNMTSQTWLRDTSNTPVWVHQLVLVEPSNLVRAGPKSEWVNLLVGNTLAKPVEQVAQDPDDDMRVAMGMATRLGTLSAVVYGVPAEFMTFNDDPLHEGALGQEKEKAYSWVHATREPDRPEFMIELPNAKAVIRAMDTLQNYTAAVLPAPVQSFAVSGFSKRGMATWMAGALDGRVKAILPGVMPLRVRSMIKNMLKSYGHPPMAVADYFGRDFLSLLDTPGCHRLFKTIDVWNYLEKLTMPKFVMMTGNDDFMLIDASRGWWDKLPGENNVFMMKPNLPHMFQMTANDFLSPAVAFLQGVVTGQAAPRIAWTIDDASGTIAARLESDHVPRAVRLWSSRTCRAHRGRRDFRQHNLDPPRQCRKCGRKTVLGCENTAARWSSVPLAPSSPGGRAWVAKQDVPTDGTWAAFYLEFEYDGPTSNFNEPWQLSTEVAILPAGYPREECFGADCNGEKGVHTLLLTQIQ